MHLSRLKGFSTGVGCIIDEKTLLEDRGRVVDTVEGAGDPSVSLAEKESPGEAIIG